MSVAVARRKPGPLPRRVPCSAEGCGRTAPRAQRWCDLHRARFDVEPGREPRPVEFVRLKSAEVDDHRELDCIHYDGCLSEVVRRGWQGWSCAQCPIRGTCSRTEPVEARRSWMGAYHDRPNSEKVTLDAWTLLYLIDVGWTQADIRRAYSPLSVRLVTKRLLALGAIVDEGGIWRATGQARCGRCKEVVPLNSLTWQASGPCGNCADCRREDRKRWRRTA